MNKSFIRYLGVVLNLLILAYLLFQWLGYFRDSDQFDPNEIIGFGLFIGGYVLILIGLILLGWISYKLFSSARSHWLVNGFKGTYYLLLFLLFFQGTTWTLSDERQFLPENMLLAMVSLVIVWTAQRIFEANKQKQKSLTLEKQRQQAELKMVKAQVNPHFLFNALNMLYSDALKIGSEEISGNLERLTEILRYHLYSVPDHPIALEDEANSLQQYVAFQEQRVKSADGIDISLKVSIESKGLRIYPLILISIIENAFKHGISHEKASFVHVSLVEQSGTVTLTTKNSNHPKKGGASSGMGSKQLQTLLAGYYPGYLLRQEAVAEVYHVELILNLEKNV